MSSNAPALLWDSGKFEFQRKLGNFVQYFQVNLPANSYGVPLKLINPLAIAEHMLDCETTDDVPEHALNAAIMDIDIEEGIPVFEGLPIWERFDGELLEYYKLFKEYREMLYVSGSRAVSRLAGTHNVAGKNLNALAKVYHWQLRCRAYDHFKNMEMARKRQFEVERLEKKHHRVADTLLETSLKYLEDHPEQLNPKVAVQMLQLAMKAGRLSLGLNPDKPGTGDAAPSINIHQTSGAGTAHESTTTVEIGSKGGSNDKPDMSYLQSIVHILDKSGALDKAKHEIIDAEYSEVDPHEAAEGAN